MHEQDERAVLIQSMSDQKTTCSFTLGVTDGSNRGYRVNLVLYVHPACEQDINL